MHHSHMHATKVQTCYPSKTNIWHSLQSMKHNGRNSSSSGSATLQGVEVFHSTLSLAAEVTVSVS